MAVGVVWRTAIVCALVLCTLNQHCMAKVPFKVRCSDETMQVEMMRQRNFSDIYLENMKNFPDKACHPAVEDSKVTFQLSLTDVYRCGVTRISNALTNRRIYYHRVVVEHSSGQPKEVLLVKCVVGPMSHNHTVLRRNVLPAGFQEPEDLEITTTLTEMAPPPVLGVGVRQSGRLVTGELNVNPGTPLEMEIYLDKESAPIYGLLVSYMQVSDTMSQEETIIFNGCSVDPYLFENFNTVDGDFLAAKFRAFKFPESNYVQFKGTVNVCLDKCQGVECSNGQKGFGRRRREVPIVPADPNNIFVVTMSTFIKVDYNDDKLLEKGRLDSNLILKRSSKKNETHVTAASEDSLGNMLSEERSAPNQFLKLATEFQDELPEVKSELQYTLVTQPSNHAPSQGGRAVSLLSGAAVCLLALLQCR
ncbi:uncharacterized protein LOC134534389 [Bacillus rossius redtenbacheri]|uniref:uncharacterized protein LOC134534389 n=1 Tax=Bacillus rossius redtenbacheri TaxID=93214 RepID=UPI002FDC99EA